MRWLFGVVIALCLACGGTDPIAPKDDVNPSAARIATVRAAYSKGCDTPTLATLPFSPEIRTLIADNEAYERRTGRVGNLDFNPLTNGQDCQNLELLDIKTNGDRVTTRVRNFGEFELVWVFEEDQLVNLEGPFGSLVATLSRPHE